MKDSEIKLKAKNFRKDLIELLEKYNTIIYVDIDGDLMGINESGFTITIEGNEFKLTESDYIDSHVLKDDE